MLLVIAKKYYGGRSAQPEDRTARMSPASLDPSRPPGIGSSQGSSAGKDNDAELRRLAMENADVELSKPAVFNKLLQLFHPEMKLRRFGPRGQSQWHCCDVRLIGEPTHISTPMLPTVLVMVSHSPT
jgi:hypothetical protein